MSLKVSNQRQPSSLRCQPVKRQATISDETIGNFIILLIKVIPWPSRHFLQFCPGRTSRTWKSRWWPGIWYMRPSHQRRCRLISSFRGRLPAPNTTTNLVVACLVFPPNPSYTSKKLLIKGGMSLIILNEEGSIWATLKNNRDCGTFHPSPYETPTRRWHRRALSQNFVLCNKFDFTIHQIRYDIQSDIMYGNADKKQVLRTTLS